MALNNVNNTNFGDKSKSTMQQSVMPQPYGSNAQMVADTDVLIDGVPGQISGISKKPLQLMPIPNKPQAQSVLMKHDKNFTMPKQVMKLQSTQNQMGSDLQQ